MHVDIGDGHSDAYIQEGLKRFGWVLMGFSGTSALRIGPIEPRGYKIHVAETLQKTLHVSESVLIYTYTKFQGRGSITSSRRLTEVSKKCQMPLLPVQCGHSVISKHIKQVRHTRHWHWKPQTHHHHHRAAAFSVEQERPRSMGKAAPPLLASRKHHATDPS